MIYTPGPWCREHWNIRRVINGKQRELVAKVLPWDEMGTRDEDHGTANLIAHAPEMYEALEELVTWAEIVDRYGTPKGIGFNPTHIAKDVLRRISGE